MSHRFSADVPRNHLHGDPKKGLDASLKALDLEYIDLYASLSDYCDLRKLTDEVGALATGREGRQDDSLWAVTHHQRELEANGSSCRPAVQGYRVRPLIEVKKSSERPSVSNYSVKNLEILLKEASVVPAVDQVC